MIKRELYLNRLRPFFHKDIVKVLTGLRRSGKSVLLQQIQQALREEGDDPASMLYYNFEDMRNLPLCQASALYEDIMEKLDGKQTAVLFFDEIQEVEGWERVVNSLRVSHGADIYVTGSNAHLLSGELATLLAGRYVAFPVYPFSFREFCLAYPDRSRAECWQSYLLHGGMPFLTHLPDDDATVYQYLQDIYRSVVLKDIVQRHAIRDVDLLERIVRYAAANIGHTFSAASIARYLKSERRSASTDTIMNYLQVCTESFLLYRIPRQDLVGKKILSINEKYYLADHGIRQAVYGRNQQDIDQTLENIVCMELLRRGYHVTVGKAGDREIDFVCEQPGKRFYVQVTYLLASPETVEREFGAYRPIRDNYPKYIVSMDPIDFSRDGIIHKNIMDFLCMDSYVM